MTLLELPMSTVVAFKNPNGLVLAADSQVTFGRSRDSNIFQSYYKVNQVGALPILTGMWGAGFLCGHDVSTALKEFWHTRFEDRTPDSWTVHEVAEDLLAFFRDKAGGRTSKNALQMLVGGYSKGVFYPDLLEFSTARTTVTPVSEGEHSIVVWRGISQGIRTLWWGYGPNFDSILKKNGVVDPKVRQAIQDQMQKAWAWGPERMSFNMPIENAARLCEFLVNLEVVRQQCWPGTTRTSGPVDVAVVTAGGVRWVHRKEGVR